MKCRLLLLITAFLALIIQPLYASLDDKNQFELDQMIALLEQDIKTLETDIGNKTGEYLQLQMNWSEKIDCSVTDNTTGNQNITPWMQYTAYGMTGISTTMTVIGPGVELIKDVQLYARTSTPIPVGAAGWPTLDFISNGFFLAHLIMNYHRNKKLAPFLLNVMASLSVMAVETGINLFLLVAYCKRKIRGSEGQVLISP